MNRGQHTHVAGMLAVPQQGGSQSGNHSLSDQSTASWSSVTHSSSSLSGGSGPPHGGAGGSIGISVGTGQTDTIASSGASSHHTIRTQGSVQSQASLGAQGSQRSVSSLSSNGSSRSLRSIFNAIHGQQPNFFPFFSLPTGSTIRKSSNTLPSITVTLRRHSIFRYKVHT